MILQILKITFIAKNYIEKIITEIENRVRVRLEMSTNYNSNYNKHEADITMENELENIKRITDVFG